MVNVKCPRVNGENNPIDGRHRCTYPAPPWNKMHADFLNVMPKSWFPGLVEELLDRIGQAVHLL